MESKRGQLATVHRKRRAVRHDEGEPGAPFTLAVDIGGTGIKALVVDAHGHPVSERVRVETPRPATPEMLLAAVVQLVAEQPPFDRISVGFPGVVRAGKIVTADNLHRECIGWDLADTLLVTTGKPARVCNDAVMQGLGAISGRGVELILTLGTGLGSALFVNGKLVPYLEVGHHTGGHTRSYSERLAKAELVRIGEMRWRQRVASVVEELAPAWECRAVYLGGGNAKLLRLAELPPGCVIVPNSAALVGGVALWPEGEGARRIEQFPSASHMQWMTVEPTAAAS
ncbi:MAG: ROK family protein [Chloroflexi bacterium]|nr:ROK family protein [Chloroflexota bacterium]